MNISFSLLKIKKEVVKVVIPIDTYVYFLTLTHILIIRRK